tara:strand:- start:2037 stop:2321 length:285 start_codon:yes stop_codon:yes gene_type:complete
MENNKSDLKSFFIKLISITLALIIVINVVFNLIFSEKIEKLFFLTDESNREVVKDKIRHEISRGLEKENILNKEDKILLKKLYIKIKNEFKEIE